MPAHSRSLSGTTEPIGQALDKPRRRKPRDLPRWSGLAAGYGDLNNRVVWCRGDEAGRPLGDTSRTAQHRPASAVNLQQRQQILGKKKHTGIALH